MSETFSTELTWEGSKDICARLIELIPENIQYNVEDNSDISKLKIFVSSDSPEKLRSIVDGLLAGFSDQDE